MSLGKLLSLRPGLSSRSLIKSPYPTTRAFTIIFPRYTNADLLGENGKHSSGTMSRTNETMQIKPPSSKPISNQYSAHHKPTLPSFSLEGRTVVVTGGARGLGLVMAQACVISGADVALVDLNEAEAAKQASAMLTAYKSANRDTRPLPKITSHYADVSDPASVESCISAILTSHAKIDSLVTSAGFTENFPATAYPPDRMRALWAVNVDGTYLFATAVARHLILSRDPPKTASTSVPKTSKSKGSMVFIGSMSGAVVNTPQPQAPYNASKAAVRHLAASFAVEWAAAGIRVNCLSPGYMRTELTRSIVDRNPALAAEWVRGIPAGRMGEPSDLMGAVVFLLSDAAAYVTGADLRVDGGYTVV